MYYSTMEITPGTAPQLDTDSSAPEVAPETYHPQYYQYKDYAGEQPQISPPPRQSEIAGLRKPTFWLLVALFSVVALALGLGTGLGLGLKNNGVGNNAGASADNEAIRNGTTSSTQAAPSKTKCTKSKSTTAASSSTSGATKTTGTARSSSSSTVIVAVPTPTAFVDSGCPGRDGNTIAGSENRSYVVHCNSDLTGANLASLVVNSLEECLALCDSLNWVQKRRDVGCVWNEKGVVGQKAGTCWCKGGDDIQVTALTGIVVATPAP
ncbi:hypothetical protein K445DRAFT_362441 [Daldinia sp. EC12]|nr:hypothetical protein K445DRAFT_362441 [Daldinia sp. EC12]